MPPPRRKPAGRRVGRPHPDPADQSADQPQHSAVSETTGQHPGNRRTGIATLVALVAVALIALGLAAWFGNEANQLSSSSAASNRALVDVGTTAQVSGQVRDAVQRVYSYDYARLDDNERAAGDVITGAFAQDFHRQFGLVRKLAPPQQAVVVATVLNVAVKTLDGDWALLVVYIDQQASRGIRTPQLAVAGRLTVTAQRVDGSWKIADVQPF